MTSTYAKRPSQSVRLGQTAQKRQSIATAPTVADVVMVDRLSGTTLAPKGATIPEIRLNRAAQSEGSVGKSSAKQAPSKTSAGVASGKLSIAPSQVMPDAQAQSQVSASSTVGGMPNVHNIILNDRKRYPGWACALILFTLIAVTWSAIYFLVTAALSLGSGS